MRKFVVYVLMLLLPLCWCQDDDYDQYGYIPMIERASHFVQQPKAQFTEQRKMNAEMFLAKGMPVDVQSRANTLLETGLGVAAEEVSELCANHTELYLDALQNNIPWALEMFDSAGKPVSGIFRGHVKWLGNWEECRDVVASDYKNSNGTLVEVPQPFIGKYCTAQVPITSAALTGRLDIGMCFPDSCTTADTQQLLRSFLDLIPMEGVGKGRTTCRENELEFSNKATSVTIVCGIIAFIIVIATIYDLIIQHVLPKKTLSGYQLFGSPIYGSIKFDLAKAPVPSSPLLSDEEAETKLLKQSPSKNTEPEVSRPELENKDVDNVYKPGIVGQALLSFSVYSNAPKILNTEQPAGTLTSVNGIRFISMTWVILGHTYAFGMQETDNIATYYPELNSRLSFQAISNATVSVDTFFVLSGLLVAYLALKEMERKGGPKKINWIMFYFHRFWRLTPPYMLLLMLYVPTYKYWSDGPMWPQKGIDKDECEETWWTNLLYVNNVVREEKMCMGWSWYLANDMQFYWISPFMLIPLFYSKIFGTISCLCFILANFLSSALISKHNEYILGGKTNGDFTEIYIKPWCRVGPYVVGIFLGYILNKTKCKVKMNKFVNLFGWMCATVVALLVLYGTYNDDTEPKFTEDTSALYTATHRTAWGMAVAWVIFACATGYGGPVNTLLSWKAILPLSRLTYCAYLVHPLVQYTYYNSRRTLMRWYDLEMIYLFLGHLCIAYGFAFVLSLAFESPMMGLEKVLLRRKKNS